MESSEKDIEQVKDQIRVTDVIRYLRMNWRNIAWFGGISFAVFCLAAICVYCFTPRVRGYQNSISILLSTKNGRFCYPSGKAFSSADLLSRAVLHKVYNDTGMKDQVPYEKFASAFFISQSSIRKDMLDAQYKVKMGLRNITVVQLTQLEREYKEALTAVQSSQLTIALNPDFPISEMQATKILNAIPEAWFSIYSVQEAARYPSPVPVQQVQDLAKEIGQDGQLILLEKSRLFCRQLRGMCSFLNDMLQGRNISLPNGEMLGDLENRLRLVERYQINVLQLYVLEHPEFYGVLDRVFLESRVKNVEFELLRMKGKYEGVIASMNALVADGAQGRNAAMQPLDKNDMNNTGVTTAPVMLQLDAGFFSSIAALIRNDINNDLRRTLAEKTMAYRDEWAELEADRARFQEILDMLDGKRPSQSKANMGKDKFYGMVREMIGELFSLCHKIKQFRELVLQEEHTSRQFCTRDTEVRAFASPIFPITRIVLGLFALLILSNLGYVAIKFLCTRKA